MSRPALVFVTPHAVAPGGLPSRPAALLDAFRASGHFRAIDVVHRDRPGAFLRRGGGRLALQPPGGRVRQLDATSRLIGHPWPFGPLESAFLARVVSRLEPPTVVWISDPKSASVFQRLASGRHRPLCVFDAYDAWDLSPLVRGRARLAAVARGYAAAAMHADLIFANTTMIAERLRGMGARAVCLLPNASPPVRPMTPLVPPYVAYVGRIHERLDAPLVSALAQAEPQLPIRIGGAVERQPAGWLELTAWPNVHLEGPLSADRALAFVGEARALLVPHIVDDYTRSQDAMKAWDALSVGTPIVSTRIPPADDWPSGLALVAETPEEFVAAVRRVMDGELDAARSDRLAFAAVNGWDARAAEAIAAIDGALASRQPLQQPPP